MDWDELLNKAPDVNSMWNIFKERVDLAIEACVPKKTVIINGKNSHRNGKSLDRKSLAKIKRKNRLWDNYCKTSDGRVYLDYCKTRNQVRSMTRKAEILLEKSIARQSRTNPKKFWQFVGKKTKSKSTIPELLVEDEEDGGSSEAPRYTKNDQEKANTFNQFFASVFNPETAMYTKVIPCKTEDKLFEISIDESWVRKKLKKLKINKSPGPDGLHPRVLHELTEVIITPLTIIYKASLSSGELPDDWKSANVTAIYKKGSRHIAGNYRPVSLTSIACKMLESIIREQVITYMKRNKLFSSKQFGFLGGRSTTLQLLRVMDEWISILDRGGAVDVIYFDFMKAFDKVSHSRLLMKLESNGIGGPLLTWIKAFLSGRKQRVVVNGAHSEWVEVTSGVPQGSVLGPLLFVVFINDLPDVVDENSSLYMFADDTKLFREISSAVDNMTLQNDITSMDDWSDEWRMFYHPGKCHVLKLGSKAPNLHELFQPSYELGGQVLDLVNSEKDLGVTIDVDLSFEKHVTEKVNKANSIVGLIRRSFTCLDKNTFLDLYKALVRPHLEYANQVWSPKLVRHINMLENVQDRATKLIPGLKAKTYEERLAKLKLPTLAYRRLRGDLIEVYKILTEKYDSDVCQGFIKLRGESTTRGNSLKIFKGRPKLDIGLYSFPHRVVDIWNKLPEQVVSAGEITIFERRLDKFLSKQAILYDYKAKLNLYSSDTGRNRIEYDDDLVQEVQ